MSRRRTSARVKSTAQTAGDLISRHRFSLDLGSMFSKRCSEHVPEFNADVQKIHLLVRLRERHGKEINLARIEAQKRSEMLAGRSLRECAGRICPLVRLLASFHVASALIENSTTAKAAALAGAPLLLIATQEAGCAVPMQKAGVRVDTQRGAPPAEANS